MGDPARDRDQDRPSAGKAPASDSEPMEAKVAEHRKIATGDAPNIEEQDPPLDATDSEDVDGDDDDEMDDTDGYSAESVTVRSSIWEHEYEGGRRVCMTLLHAGSLNRDASLTLLCFPPASITTIDAAAIPYQMMMKSKNESI